MYILSQILVVVSDLIFIASMLNNKKRNIEFCLGLSTVLFAAHYLCLSAWTGAAIAFVELAFLILMYVLDLKGKTQYNTVVSFVTILITMALSIITWGGWISILPMLAMVAYLTGMIFNNVIIVKSATFIRVILNGVYMLLVKSYFGAGLSIAILIFTVIGIVDDYKSYKTVK